MSDFRQENSFLIRSAAVFGLYMYSIERFVTNKCVLAFLTVWTKFPAILLTLIVTLDSRAMIFEEDVLRKFATLRKVVGTFNFLLKNIFFYKERRRFEKFFDLWDNSFKEEFFPEKHLISKQNNQKENRKIVTGSVILGVTTAFLYSVPSYFNKKKEIMHPSGIIYSRRSPDFELVVTFDVWVSFMSISAVTFDCILMVFLSHVRSKLVFLRETLADIIDELIIDEEGKLLGRRTRPQVAFSQTKCSEQNFPNPDHQRQSQENDYEELLSRDREYRKNVANIDRKLRIWIIHHQQTIAFFEEISRTYSRISTFVLGHNVFYTAMTALNIVKMKISFDALGTFLVASCNLLSLFFWCKLSGELQVDVFGDAFSQAWFLLPKKLKSTFSLIIIRSKKPLSLYGFSLYRINLALFFDILKLAYQFFAFMVQISDDET